MLLVLKSGDDAQKPRAQISAPSESWTPVDLQEVRPGSRISLSASDAFRLRVNGKVFYFNDSNSVMASDIPKGATVEVRGQNRPVSVALYY